MFVLCNKELVEHLAPERKSLPFPRDWELCYIAFYSNWVLDTISDSDRDANDIRYRSSTWSNTPVFKDYKDLYNYVTKEAIESWEDLDDVYIQREVNDYEWILNYRKKYADWPFLYICDRFMASSGSSVTAIIAEYAKTAWIDQIEFANKYLHRKWVTLLWYEEE